MTMYLYILIRIIIIINVFCISVFVDTHYKNKSSFLPTSLK